MAHINFVHSFDEFLSLPESSKDMEFQTDKDDNHGWKLHVFLDQNNKTVSNPIIRDTAKYLIDNNVSFKMGNGGDGGKIFTIYIGEYDESKRVAAQLNTQFGDIYKKDSPSGGINLPEDMHIFNNIGMRFEGVKDNWSNKNKDSAFSYYGFEGIPSLCKNLQFDGKNDHQLSALACHIFLAEKCGVKYLGRNYEKNPWANKIFENLQKKYTSKEISDYVKDALKYLRATHQERFIYNKNIVSSGQGILLSISDIIPLFKQPAVNNEIEISVKNLGIMPDADKVFIHKNKFGNDILEYKKGDKLLASCSINGESHLVRLYSDDGKFTEYMTSTNQRAKRFVGGVLYPITSSYLESRIENIVSFSKAIAKKNMINNSVNKINPQINYRQVSKER